MKKSEIIKNIKKSEKIPTDQNWLKQGRHFLQSFIVDNPVRKPEPVRQQMAEGIFKKLILKPMPIVIIALIISLTAGSGVVAAAQGSLPTDILYPVKLATEKVQTVVTFNQVKKIELQTRLADKRLEEIERLQDKNEATEEVVTKTLKKYEAHLAIAQSYLNTLGKYVESPKIIKTALALETAIEKQQSKLDIIDSRASPEYKSSLAYAKSVALENSSYNLSKIGDKIKETASFETAETAVSTYVSTYVEFGTKEIIFPTISEDTATEEMIPEYITSLEQKAKNRIKTAENKLAEARKKIDTFINQKENKCTDEKKKNYLEELESHYQKMTMALEEAKKLFNEKKYLGSLNQSNYVIGEGIEIDNLIGQWYSRCGEDEQTIVIVPVGQKFEMKVGQTVTVRNENIKIYLSKVSSSCPPCPKGQFCALYCPAPTATFIITYPPKEIAQIVNLSLNEKEKISGNIYLNLLAVSENQVTVILTEEYITVPREKRVYLNQKFDLSVSQTAQVVDYKNLKIKFQSVAEVVCVKAPCPSPIATFQATLPGQCSITGNNTTIINSTNPETPVSAVPGSSGGSSDTRVCSAGLTTIFNLNSGQSKYVLGVKATLLDLSGNLATLIINKEIQVCPIPDCRYSSYKTGEYDSNDCPIYKCSENKKSCEAVFSNCNCGYTCAEIIPGEDRLDCARACRVGEMNPYKPNCGYRNGVCQDLNEEPTCPKYDALPAPGWCDGGKIYPGEIYRDGCQGPPICVMPDVVEIETGGVAEAQPNGQISETTSGEMETGESFFAPLLKILGF